MARHKRQSQILWIRGDEPTTDIRNFGVSCRYRYLDPLEPAWLAPPRGA